MQAVLGRAFSKLEVQQMMRSVDVDRSTGIEYDEFFSIMAPKMVQHRLKSGGVETVAGRLDVQGVHVCGASLSRFLPLSLSSLSLSSLSLFSTMGSL